MNRGSVGGLRLFSTDQETEVGNDGGAGAERTNGTVKWFDPKKGFGFISSDSDGQDYFVHFSSIEGQSGHRSLEDGEKVEFVPGQDARTGKTVAQRVTGPDGTE